MLKVENFMKTIKISSEIDQKVESWFSGETWCIPVDYDDKQIVIENPYKPRKLDMTTCICNRGPRYVCENVYFYNKINPNSNFPSI